MTNKDVDRVPVVRGRTARRLSHPRRHCPQTHWILTMPAESHTLTIVKPDAFGTNKAGKIIAHLEAQGFRIRAARVLHLTEAQAEEFYARASRASVLRIARDVHDLGTVHAARAREGRCGGRASQGDRRDRSEGGGAGHGARSSSPSRRSETRSMPRIPTRTPRANRDSSSPKRSCSRRAEPRSGTRIGARSLRRRVLPSGSSSSRFMGYAVFRHSLAGGPGRNGRRRAERHGSDLDRRRHAPRNARFMPRAGSPLPVPAAITGAAPSRERPPCRAVDVSRTPR